MTEKDEARIRVLMEKELSQPLSDEDFGFLLLEGQVARIRAVLGQRGKQSAAVRAAARTIRNLWAAQGEPVVGKTEVAGQMAPEEGRRRYALSRLLALEAEDDDAVLAFRSKHLGSYPGHKVPWEEIGDYIQTTAREEGAPTEFILLALPTGARHTPTQEGLRVEDDTPLSGAQIENRVESRMLSYGLPGAKWVQHVGVRVGGVLDELWHLTDRLVKRYGWKEDQAAVFILSGVTPYLPGIRLETDYREDCPAASRITLIVDPFVPPQEVLGTYSRVRQQILKGRYRPLSEKHLRLAVFAAEQKRKGVTWAAVMEEWNQAHPGETYTQETVFARDATAARKRLLTPRLNPDGLLEMVAKEQKKTE